MGCVFNALVYSSNVKAPEGAEASLRIAAAEEDSANAVEYTGSTTGHTAGYKAWKDEPLFAGIRPCILKDGKVVCYLDPNDFSKKADGTAAPITDRSAGDVMIEIPKIGYRITNDGTYVEVSLTREADQEGYCYLAHGLNAEGDCDKLYVGAYPGYVNGEKLYSVSGVTPSSQISLADLRTYAAARGTGYQLFSFYPLTLLQCLYLMMFKNRDGQLALGTGYLNGNAAGTTGETNAGGMCCGAKDDDTGRVKLFGIEDFWGNLVWYIDGLYCDGDYRVRTAFRGFDRTADYSDAGASGFTEDGAIGIVKDVIGTNQGGFLMKSGTTGAANVEKYWCDISYLKSAAYGLGVLMGNWSLKMDSTNVKAFGPFGVWMNYDGSAQSLGGARLIYKHPEILADDLERTVLTGEGTFSIPTGVTELHYVLIGGAQGGRAGKKGGSGSVEVISSLQYSLFGVIGEGGDVTDTYNGYHPGVGGAGGDGGQGGAGGKILQGTLDVSGISSLSYQCGAGGTGAAYREDAPDAEGNPGGDTALGSLTTANGASVPSGFTDVMTGETYGASGQAGISGGNGAGGLYIPITDFGNEYGRIQQAGSVTDEDGNVWAGGVTMMQEERPYMIEGDGDSFSFNGANDNGCAGAEASVALGSGAAGGQAGTDGGTEIGTYSVSRNDAKTLITARAEALPGIKGASATLTPKKAANGNGGRGGYGGGGGSSPGLATTYSGQDPEDALLGSFDLKATPAEPGEGGSGGAGGEGSDGVILLYYRKTK